MHLPSAFYPADAYALGAHDMRKPWVGLFRGPFFIRVTRFLYTGPGSAWKGFSARFPMGTPSHDSVTCGKLCRVWWATSQASVAPCFQNPTGRQRTANAITKSSSRQSWSCSASQTFQNGHTDVSIPAKVYRDAVAPEVDPNAAAEEDDSDDEFAACRRAPSARSPSPE
ncbi:hypothetical protein C8F01DRAFT_145212 [Mycena amicta]|nr:hypothetical protein C8F01DRAFT_145212 [Mycena amicta]